MNSFGERDSAEEGRQCNWKRGWEEADLGHKEDRPPLFTSSESLDHLSC